MNYFPDDVWLIIKEFMLDWQKSWHKKLQLSLDCRWLNISNGDKYEKGSVWRNRESVGIKSQFPIKILWENYNLQNKLYYTYFRVPRLGRRSEMRISYNYAETVWSSDDFEGGYSL